MERVFGQSLLSQLVSSPQLPVEESFPKRIIKQILQAVDYMHNRGVVHRDMNPTNVIIDENERVKIIDFNVSKLVENHNNIKKQPLTGTPPVGRKNQRKSSDPNDMFDNMTIEEQMEGLQINDEGDGPQKESPQRYIYSLFTKTGTPLYSAPEMQQAVKYK